MKAMTAAVFCIVLILSHFAGAAELQVFAAASLTDALKEVASRYESASGDRLVFNFAASSLLARQIEEGAPADLFFSADEEKMDWLQKKGLIVEKSRKSLLSNSLVIVLPLDGGAAVGDPRDLATSGWKIAMAQPKTVPAGIYAKKYLERIGIWSRVQDRVVPTENVRAALAAVESGNVDAGIVYGTDARMSKRVRVAYQIAAGETPEISYPLAIIRESRNYEAAMRCAAYVSSPEALGIFQKFGFRVR